MQSHVRVDEQDEKQQRRVKSTSTPEIQYNNCTFNISTTNQLSEIERLYQQFNRNHDPALIQVASSNPLIEDSRIGHFVSRTEEHPDKPKPMDLTEDDLSVNDVIQEEPFSPRANPQSRSFI